MSKKDAVTFRSKVITPQDFIYMLMDLYSLEPHLEDRNSKGDFEFNSFKDNPPRSVRYKRLYAILKAYGFFKDLDLFHPLHSFINGGFITDSYTPDPSLDKKLAECLETIDTEEIWESGWNSPGTLKPCSLKEFFIAIMHYRMGVYRSDDYFWGYLAMDQGTRQAASIVYELRGMFIDPINHILDEVLLLFLNNDSVKPYTVGELINKYGYPKTTDEELSDIDVDWM